MNAETLSMIQAITNARITFVRISTPILLVLGSIGEMLSILIFLQRIFRMNSCVIYFLAASCTRLFFMYSVILLNGLAFGYNIDPSRTSLIFCKIKLYLSYVTAIVPPSLVVLACIDRFMSSSLNVNHRLWSTPRFAYRFISLVSIFWIVFSIHALFGSKIFSTGNSSFCSIEEGTYSLFVVLYSIIINYLLSPILMIIFGLLTIINVRQTQQRVRGRVLNGALQRKDHYLLHMLLFQVLTSVIFTIPMAAYQIYSMISAGWQKNPIWKSWDGLIFLVVFTIFFIPYCAGFYIYTLTGRTFRKEFQRLIIHYYRRFIPRKQPQTTIETITLN